MKSEFPLHTNWIYFFYETHINIYINLPSFLFFLPQKQRTKKMHTLCWENRIRPVGAVQNIRGKSYEGDSLSPPVCAPLARDGLHWRKDLCHFHHNPISFLLPVLIELTKVQRIISTSSEKARRISVKVATSNLRVVQTRMLRMLKKWSRRGD